MTTTKLSWNIHISDRKSITMSDFTNLIQQYLDVSQIRIVVDAGSLNGDDAEFIRNRFPHTKAYAIEGLLDNYEQFIKVKTSIIGINRIISSYDGEITFYKKNINGIHGIYDRGQNYGTETIVGKCSRLDTIMDEYNIPVIDIIKIDVEGATYDALKSLGKHLEMIKIMHIETETYPFFKGQTLHNTVCEFLEANNFTLVDITFAEITNQCYQSDSVWVNNRFI